LYVSGQTLTYTGISGTTTFTGIPASGTGSITATIAVDANVWQNLSPGLPDYYVIDRGNIKFDRPLHSDYSTFPIKIRYYKALTALSEFSDSTSVTFTNVFPSFIAARIEERKGNLERAQYYMGQFEKQVLNNALSQRVPSADVGSYYAFGESANYYLGNSVTTDSWSRS
jgi:hypothetical protein